MINLIINARQALGGSSGRITVSSLLSPESRFVVIEVLDTGRGMSKEELRQLTDPFFTTRPAGEGTGLGLAITRSIIQAHRGMITIESEVGKGTLVRIVLRLGSGSRPS